MVEPRASNPLAQELGQVNAEMGPLWDELRGARVFLTGGTGFFGCWLLETLLWANDVRSLGATAVVLTRDPSAFRKKAPRLASHPLVVLCEGDVRTFRFPDGAVTHIIHAAVETTNRPAREDRLREFDSTIAGTRRVLEFARSRGARRLLFTSSGSVYGTPPKDLLRVPEIYSGAPDVSLNTSAGAEAKRAAEMLCAVYSDAELAAMSARCFTFVGPYLPLDDKFAVGNFIRDGLNGGPIRVAGDGTAIRSYMYGADLAVWLWTILLRGLGGRTYNVGSEDPISIGDLARAVARRFTPEPPVTIQSSTPAAGQGRSRYVPDTTRARTELGLRLRVEFDEALTRTVRWHTTQFASSHVR